MVKWISFENTLNCHRPEWEKHEPKDGRDSVIHEEYSENRSKSNITLLAASIRGKSHAHRGEWREDAFAYSTQGSWSLMAVADGAGSCSLSRIGAHCAVHAAVNCMVKKVNLKESGLDSSPQKTLMNMREHLASAGRAAINALRAEAINRGINCVELSTTLIAGIHLTTAMGDFVGIFQVGDGVALTWNSSGDGKVLGSPDHGIYAGESIYLTQTELESMIEQRIYLRQSTEAQNVALLTDGVADDFLVSSNGVRCFCEEMRTRVLLEDNPLDALRVWLSYEKPGSYDDRTVLLAVRSTGQNEALVKS